MPAIMMSIEPERSAGGSSSSPEAIDHAVRIYEHFQAGDLVAARAAYERVLPTIVFVMQSIETFICYGKRIFALRAGGFEVHDRASALRPTAFGLTRAKEHAASPGLMLTTHPAAS
jgi:4-hydroxy-tetrahydrodipicolinate synthase